MELEKARHREKYEEYRNLKKEIDSIQLRQKAAYERMASEFEVWRGITLRSLEGKSETTQQNTVAQARFHGTSEIESKSTSSKSRAESKGQVSKSIETLKQTSRLNDVNLSLAVPLPAPSI